MINLQNEERMIDYSKDLFYQFTSSFDSILGKHLYLKFSGGIPYTTENGMVVIPNHSKKYFLSLKHEIAHQLFGSDFRLLAKVDNEIHKLIFNCLEDRRIEHLWGKIYEGDAFAFEDVMTQYLDLEIDRMTEYYDENYNYLDDIRKVIELVRAVILMDLSIDSFKVQKYKDKLEAEIKHNKLIKIIYETTINATKLTKTVSCEACYLLSKKIAELIKNSFDWSNSNISKMNEVSGHLSKNMLGGSNSSQNIPAKKNNSMKRERISKLRKNIRIEIKEEKNIKTLDKNKKSKLGDMNKVKFDKLEDAEKSKEKKEREEENKGEKLTEKEMDLLKKHLVINEKEEKYIEKAKEQQDIDFKIVKEAIKNLEKKSTNEKEDLYRITKVSDASLSVSRSSEIPTEIYVREGRLIAKQLKTFSGAIANRNSYCGSSINLNRYIDNYADKAKLDYYNKKVFTGNGLEVVMLVDLSGSMKSIIGYVSDISVMIKSAANDYEGLDLKVMGFRSKSGKSAIIKFESINNIAGMHGDCGGSTPMIAAVRYALAQFNMTDIKKKLFIMITDGGADESDATEVITKEFAKLMNKVSIVGYMLSHRGDIVRANQHGNSSFSDMFGEKGWFISVEKSVPLIRKLLIKSLNESLK